MCQGGPGVCAWGVPAAAQPRLCLAGARVLCPPFEIGRGFSRRAPNSHYTVLWDDELGTKKENTRVYSREETLHMAYGPALN